MVFTISPVKCSEETHVGRQWTKVFLAIVALTSSAAGAFAWAQQPETRPPDASSALPLTTGADSNAQAIVADDYLIAPQDVLDIYVFGVPEISREYTVTSAGTITLPLLANPVQAAGLSPEQLAANLQQSFRESGRLSRPQITVSVKQAPRSVVVVEGAVKTPQIVPVIGRSKLLYVISQAGGVAEDAGDTATVTRGAVGRRDSAAPGESASSALTVDLKQLMDGNHPSSNVDIFPGDRVTVERSGLFYVLGEVNHPGGYNLKSAQEQLTVLEALAVAGDVTTTAKKSKAMLIRKDSKAPNGRDEIALNLNDILALRSPDRTLRANDILYIPASGGKRAWRGFASTATVIAGSTASGLVLYRR